MKLLSPLAAILYASMLAGCAQPNLRSASSYNAPTPPPIKQFYYDPYAAYGSANATWTPPVIDRQGTITKPVEPSTSNARPDYETAPWANGARGGSSLAPPGTF